jgi:hypothetical protein
MAAFKLKPGMGETETVFGMVFTAGAGTEVDDPEAVERLRAHFMFEEVVDAAPKAQTPQQPQQHKGPKR